MQCSEHMCHASSSTARSRQDRWRRIRWRRSASKHLKPAPNESVSFGFGQSIRAGTTTCSLSRAQIAKASRPNRNNLKVNFICNHMIIMYMQSGSWHTFLALIVCCIHAGLPKIRQVQRTAVDVLYVLCTLFPQKIDWMCVGSSHECNII